MGIRPKYCASCERRSIVIQSIYKDQKAANEELESLREVYRAVKQFHSYACCVDGKYFSIDHVRGLSINKAIENYEKRFKDE